MKKFAVYSYATLNSGLIIWATDIHVQNIFLKTIRRKYNKIKYFRVKPITIA
jgi:hypothetical protein